MKVIIALAFILLVTKGYGQQLTYKDLIGKWYSVDSAEKDAGSFYFIFHDSTHLTVHSDSTEDKYLYHFEWKQDLIAINFTSEGLDQTFLLKLKSDTLKWQFSLNAEDLKVWQLPESHENTGVLVKAKRKSIKHK